MKMDLHYCKKCDYRDHSRQVCQFFAVHTFDSDTCEEVSQHYHEYLYIPTQF